MTQEKIELLRKKAGELVFHSLQDANQFYFIHSAKKIKRKIFFIRNTWIRIRSLQRMSFHSFSFLFLLLTKSNLASFSQDIVNKTLEFVRNVIGLPLWSNEHSTEAFNLIGYVFFAHPSTFSCNLLTTIFKSIATEYNYRKRTERKTCEELFMKFIGKSAQNNKDPWAWVKIWANFQKQITQLKLQCQCGLFLWHFISFLYISKFIRQFFFYEFHSCENLKSLVGCQSAFYQF